MEGDRLATLHALVHVNLEHFLLADDLATVTGLALVLVVDDFACPGTFVASALKLLDHRAHLSESDTNTATAAAITRSYCTLLSTFPVALDTDDVTSEGQLCRLALV